MVWIISTFRCLPTFVLICGVLKEIGAKNVKNIYINKSESEQF